MVVKRLFPFLSLLSIAAVLLAYTGPGNRTVTQTVETCTAFVLECSWKAGKGWGWRQTGNDWACSNESKPWLAWPKLTGQSCAAGNEGEERWTQDVTSDTTTVTYAPVSVSSTMTCGLPGSAGWCRGGLTQTLTASESIPSHVVRYFENAAGLLCDPADAASVTCSRSITPQGTDSDSMWAVSSFGDTSLMQSYSWKLDSGLPTNLTSFPSPNGQNGWHASPLSGSFSGADATSGIDPAGYRWRVNGSAWQSGTSITVAADGVHTVDTETRDVAGNTNSQAVTIQLDQTPPVVFIPLNPDGENGWYISQPTILLTASDAASGIATAVFEGFGADRVTLPDGIHPLTAIAQDMAGNTWAVSETVRVDTQPPALAPAMRAPTASGWHTSAVTASANASDLTSGLALVEYHVNGGAWQTSSSANLTDDGKYMVEFRAADNAGNRTVSPPQSIQIDQTPPVSAFSNPPEGSTTKISGTFTFSGRSADALSGLDLAEISLDNGATWQPLTLASGNWSYAWDSRLVRDGTYSILVRAGDMAGNREDTARVQVIVANAPPRIELQESWWLWEAGRVRVRIGDIPVQSVTVLISCAPHHRDVTLRYTADTLPAEIRWDRRCGEGAYAAESGDYPVTATVCDGWGRCATANGVIKVPFIAPPVPTITPTIQPTATGLPSPTAQARKPSPTPTVTVAALPTLEPPAESQAAPPPVPSSWLWTLVVLPGLWLVFSLNSLTDPRPAALRRLGQAWQKVIDHARG